MKIKFLNKAGKCDEKKSTKKDSPHYDNLDFLDRNPTLKNSIAQELVPYFDSFFYTRPYMNSGEVSVTVCKNLNLPDDAFNHSLVGSQIYETFKDVDPTSYGISRDTELIASKGEEQHYVDYFLAQ